MGLKRIIVPSRPPDLFRNYGRPSFSACFWPNLGALQSDLGLSGPTLGHVDQLWTSSTNFEPFRPESARFDETRAVFGIRRAWPILGTEINDVRWPQIAI